MRNVKLKEVEYYQVEGIGFVINNEFNYYINFVYCVIVKFVLVLFFNVILS